MKSDLIDIAVTLHHETPKAWLVSGNGKRESAVWIAKSLARMEVRGMFATLKLSKRLTKDKGLA